MSRKKGSVLVRWTDEEIEMLQAHVQKYSSSTMGQYAELAKTLNECIWNGKPIRSTKAVSLRTAKMRRQNKNRITTPTATAPKLPDPPKEELSMAELGEAVYEHTRSLIAKIQSLADEVAARQEEHRQTVEHYKGVVARHKETIEKLNQNITYLNKKVHNETRGKTFKLSELAHR